MFINEKDYLCYFGHISKLVLTCFESEGYRRHLGSYILFILHEMDMPQVYVCMEKNANLSPIFVFPQEFRLGITIQEKHIKMKLQHKRLKRRS